MPKRIDLSEVVGWQPSPPTGDDEAVVAPHCETVDPAPETFGFRSGRRPDSRKDTVLWPDQHAELDRLAWQLSRRRAPGEGERITSNTLIRVAVDVLLTQRGRLVGVTEEELLASALAAVDSAELD